MNNKKLIQACATCYLSKICLPVGLATDDMVRLDNIITKRRVIERGEAVVQEGEEFSKLIAVRSGSFKSISNTISNREQVMGFYLPGELLGFDGIHSGQYRMTSRALETSSVCEIPFNQLLALSAELPSLQQQFVRLMSEKLNPELSIGINNTAEQRLAAFLLSISHRYKHCRHAADEFNLTMSRDDIGNYLGLATETISRLFTAMQNDAILKVARRSIKIEDFRRLQLIVCAKT